MEIRADKRGSDEQLLAMLADPSFSLQVIADTNRMTLFDLAEWSERPRVAAAIRALRRLHRARADLLASESAAAAISALTTLCSSIEHEERHALPSSEPRAIATRARNRETVRKCSAQLIQVVKRTPKKHRRRASTGLAESAGSAPQQGEPSKHAPPPPLPADMLPAPNSSPLLDRSCSPQLHLVEAAGSLSSVAAAPPPSPAGAPDSGPGPQSPAGSRFGLTQDIHAVA